MAQYRFKPLFDAVHVTDESSAARDKWPRWARDYWDQSLKGILEMSPGSVWLDVEGTFEEDDVHGRGRRVLTANWLTRHTSEGITDILMREDVAFQEEYELVEEEALVG